MYLTCARQVGLQTNTYSTSCLYLFGRKAEGIFPLLRLFFPIFNEMDGHFCYKHRVTMLSGLPMVMDLEEINPFLVSLAKSPGSIFLCHSHIW